MKFPYGISDFDSLITEKYYYVDRTDRIPLREVAGKQLLFLLLPMLENYYDLNKADRFEQLLGGLAIGKNPTADHNRYFVLKWDFSGVSPVGDGEETKRNLYAYVNDRISEFSIYYRATLPGPLQIDPQDALSYFRSLLVAVQQTGYSLYLLIDEYDNFTNELMMSGHRSVEESRYQAISSGEGCMKALFKTIKAAAGGWERSSSLAYHRSLRAISPASTMWRRISIYCRNSMRCAVSGKRKSLQSYRRAPRNATYLNPVPTRRFP